ncbi:MAG: lysine biosynthesis protein LysX [Candidatus Hodarchaeota archaeon]
MVTRVGIVVDRVRPDERLLFEAVKKAGGELVIIDSKTHKFSLTKPNNIEADITIMRCVGTLKGLYITFVLENQGLEVINPYLIAENCFDKVKTSVILAKNGIPTPKTVVGFDVKSAFQIAEEMGYPVIFKPVIGSWARMVAKVNDPQTAKTLLEHRSILGNAFHKIYYIQEYIAKPDRDIRSIVIGDEVIPIYRVIQTESEWRTNTALGGRAEPCPLTPEIEELSLKAAEAVGGGVLGVDLIENKDQLMVLEINHSTEFKNVQRVSGVNIAEKIIQYARNKVRK